MCNADLMEMVSAMVWDLDAWYYYGNASAQLDTMGRDFMLCLGVRMERLGDSCVIIIMR